MSNTSYEHTLPLLDSTSVEDACWHVSATTCLVQCVQAPPDDAFKMYQTVSHIREITLRGTVVQDGSTVIKEDVHWVVLTHCITTTHGVRWRAMVRWRVSLAARNRVDGSLWRQYQTPRLATAGGPVTHGTSPCRTAPRHAHV
jgi:hypothetical protein